MVQYKYISADNHIDQHWLPKNLWQERMAKRFKAIGPKVIETPDGSRWEWEGKLHNESADGSLNDKYRQSHFGSKGVDTPQGSLPPSTPKLLLEHLDMASIYTAIFYTEPPMWEVKDPALYLEIHRCYNDFLLDMNRQAPERIVALPALPTQQPETCVDEMLRVVKAGAKAVEFNVYDADPPLWSPVWDRLWSTAEELEIPIGVHLGFKAGMEWPPNEHGQLVSFFATAPFCAALPIAHFIIGGVLERHPKLHVSYAECRVGWLPFFISWLDRSIQRRVSDPTVKLSLLPSEYFARQMTVTFEDDYVGARMVPMDWTYLRDSALWGADYAHRLSVWPKTTETVDAVFKGFPADLKDEILYHRAARVFKLNVPKLAGSAADAAARAAG